MPMPRIRNPFKKPPRPRQFAKPIFQAPKPAANAVPKPSDLDPIYKRLLTADTAERVKALIDAVNWFDKAMPFLVTSMPGKALDAGQQKQYAIAQKARNLGLGEQTPDAQETALLTAVRIYEKIWPAAAKLSQYWDKYKEQKADLEAALQKEQEKILAILGPLDQAFGALGVGFTLEPEQEKARQINVTEKKVLLSKDLFKALATKAKDEGILPVLFSEAHTALYASCLSKGDDGAVTPDLNLLAKNVPVMLESILKFCAATDVKVFKGFEGHLQAAVQPQAQAAPKAPRAPRPMGAPGAGKNGPYFANSAKGVLFGRLMDGQFHPFADLFANLPACKDGMERLRTIRSEGKKNNDWTIVITGTQAQMTIHNPAYQRP